MTDKATQDLIWNAYIDKYNAEPSNATQLHSFSKNKPNNITILSFSNARKVYTRNKGKGIIQSQSNASSVDAQFKSSSKKSAVIQEPIPATTSVVLQKEKDPKESDPVSDDTKITATDIDDILNEIEENEVKLAQDKAMNNDPNNNWNTILRELGNGNIHYIKNLISSNDIDINAQNPQNGMTLLMYATIIGNIELIKALCNFGASVHIQDHDGDDVLKYAIKYSRYNITELLYYRTLSGRLGSDLKDIAIQIHRKNKEAAFMMSNKFKMGDLMIKAMEQRAPFGQDMLFYAWYFVLHGDKEEQPTNNSEFNFQSRYFTPYNEKIEPLKSKLFETMMKTYESIISNTSDKDGWKWLRENFINSLIWYLPHPVYSKTDHDIDEKNIDDDDGDDAGDDIDKILKKTLFYELLIRVRAESKKQSDLLLNEKINNIKLKSTDEWNRLTTYNVVTQHSKIARQDLCGCLQPKYTETDLSEDIYPSSIHFSAKKHYDKNIYLNELLFYANIMDKPFQKDMKQITREINSEIGENVLYSAGPVKTLIRSQAKVENDYIAADFPSSARILDINRCALHCNTIPSMLKFIETFVSKIKSKKGYSVIDIIRCKNGWNIYDVNYPQYTDIKLNVLVQSNKKQRIIAEVQLLLDLMSDFKRKAHKLYSIERKFELVYNFGKLTAAMQSFEDYSNINDILIRVVDMDDIKQFKLFWNTSHCNIYALFPDGDKFNKQLHDTALFHILTNTNSKINQYFVNECAASCCKALLVYIKKYVNTYTYGTFFYLLADSKYIKHHETPDHLTIGFLDQLFDLMSASNLRKFFFVHHSNSTALSTICNAPRTFKRTLHFILNTPKIDDDIRCDLLFNDNAPFNEAFYTHRMADNMNTILQYIKNDRVLLLKALSSTFDSNSLNIMAAICASTDPFSIKALRLLLYHELITGNEKMKALKHADSSYHKNTSMHYAFSNKNIYNVLEIMDYYNKTNKKRLMELLLIENERGDTPLYCASDFKVLRKVFHYFKDTKSDLKHLLSVKNKEGRTVFAKICQYERDPNVDALRFILYSDTLRLSKEDKFELMNTVDNDGFIPLMYCPDIVCVEMLKYIENDKEMLLKLLSVKNKDKRSVLMFLGRANTRPYMLTLNLILNSNILDDKDKFVLLSQQDINGKSVLYHAATLCPSQSSTMHFEDAVDTMPPLKIIEYLKCDQDILKKVLLQKSNDGDTFLIPIAKGDRVTFPILQSLRSIKDKSIISQLLQSKNNKGETVYLLSCEVPNKPQKGLIEQWLDLIQFESELNNDEKNNIDFSFVEEKTNKTTQKAILNKCICGMPLRLSTAAVINRTQRMVTCNRCNATERGQVYNCQNRGYFMSSGRRMQHRGAFVVCTQCIRNEIAEIRADEAKKIASSESKEYKTNPFIACCRFLQYEICVKVLDCVAQNKELMIKLLTSKYGRTLNTPIHYICNQKDGALSVKMMQLLVLNNKLLSDSDKLMILNQRNYYKISPLNEANALCGIEIINYFKKDKNELLSLISPLQNENESNHRPPLLFICDDIRIVVLQYFNDDRDSLLKLLSFKNGSSGLKLFAHICSSKKNEIKSVKFILKCSALNYADKMNLFNEKWGNGDCTPFDAASSKDWSFKEKEIAFCVLQFIEKDVDTLLLFLNRSVHGKTPLMQFCSNNDDWSVNSVKLIMNNKQLKKEDKLKLLLDGDPTSLQIACQNKERAEFVLEIFKCFENDEESLIKLMSHSDGLLYSARFGNDTIRMRTLLNVINTFDDKLQWKLLSDTNYSSKKQTFLYLMDKIFTVFCCIDNDDILYRLIAIKDNEYENVLDYVLYLLQSGTNSKESYNFENKNAKCIVYFMDYFRMKPQKFINICYFAKYSAIKRMIKSVGNDLDKIKSLFINCYDEDGNNCLMLLSLNHHFKILMHLLNGVLSLTPDLRLHLLSEKNMFSGENIITNLCKNAHFDVIQSIFDNINDNKIAFNLLNEKDNDNKSCFDYVEANHFINTYKIV